MDTLRERRRRMGLTLTVLAGRVGITAGQLSRIERVGNASLATASALEQETGVPAATIGKGAAKRDQAA